MSLSLRDELRVVLSPGQVLLVRAGREFTRRGLTRRVLDQRVVSCPAVEKGELPWSAAIRTLESELPAMAANVAVAIVILSSHFVRYALVPWSAALRNDVEEADYARHFFRRLYGTAADTWELRLSPERAGAPQLASAVEPGLPDAVRAVFASAGVSLRSIQPGLMTAYNSCRKRLEGCDAWFVVHEPGSLCLSLLKHGRWISVRTLRAGSGWRDSLPLLLDREEYLIEQEAAASDVFLFTSEGGDAVLPEGGRWKFQELQPATHSGFTPGYDARFAMAMGG